MKQICSRLIVLLLCLCTTNSIANTTTLTEAASMNTATTDTVAINTIAADAAPAAIKTTADDAAPAPINTAATDAAPAPINTAATDAAPAPINTAATDAVPAPINTAATDAAPAAINTTATDAAPAPIKTTADDAAPKETSRLWNLQDADILSIINEVSLETGKNFIVDPRVSGKISLISSKPIQSSEVYPLFLSILELLGYSAISHGNTVKIVPNAESGEFATNIANKMAPGKGAEVVVRIVPLENIAANQVIPIIRPLLPQWSNLSAYTPANVLIILGRADNLKRIVSIIQQVDGASNNTVDIVPLHHAAAGQLAVVLTNLQSAARSTGDIPLTSIAADERTNSILISGNKAARLRERLLISHLDNPSSGAQGNTQVIYLRYLQAKTFAPTLGKIAQNILGKDNNANNTAATSGSPNPKAPENTTSIQAEPDTNAIIITAPPTLMTALRNIVAKLDIRPAQVLVEAMMVEIDEDNLKNLGIQWGSFSNDAELNTALSLGGFMPLGLGSVGIIPSQQFVAILGILQSTSGIDILSTPSIVVLDNQKASLAVGTQVADQTGSYATTGSTSTVTPFNTINRLNVLLKLDVTPQINLGNAVRLKIVLKNDSLKNPDNPGLNPTVNTSAITNSVIVNSKDVLVIGGLISNSINDSNTGVPFLSDIPILGYLFQHKTHRLAKKNLLVFIKPSILHNKEDATSITNTKYDYIRERQIYWPENLKSEGKQKIENILPPFQKNISLPKPFGDA
jgi:general secretion pathway protein D